MTKLYLFWYILRISSLIPGLDSMLDTRDQLTGAQPQLFSGHSAPQLDSELFSGPQPQLFSGPQPQLLTGPQLQLDPGQLTGQAGPQLESEEAKLPQEFFFYM